MEFVILLLLQAARGVCFPLSACFSPRVLARPVPRGGPEAQAAHFRPPGGPLWGPRHQSGGRGPAARHERAGGRGGRGGARKGRRPATPRPEARRHAPARGAGEGPAGGRSRPGPQAGGEEAPRPRPPTSALKSHIIRRARGACDPARSGARGAEGAATGRRGGGSAARHGGWGRGATRAAKARPQRTDDERAGCGGPEGRAA